MSSTTLSKLDVTQLDSSGNGTIILRPDRGQNWAPLFVRVSSNNQGTPIPYCALYHGSPGVPAQATQFIDDTYLGNGDTSSMISGTPVLFGEALIFKFQNGVAKDTVSASVFGMTSDLPPNLDLIPQVPGTHFSGHLITEIVKDIDTNFVGVPLVSTGIFNSNIFDMRLFGSFYLELFALTSTSPATGINPVQIMMNWYNSATQQTVMFQDTYEWWADNQTGPINTIGNVMIQDAVHGPYMGFQLFNNAAADSVRVSYVLKGTTRTGLPLSVRQQFGGSFFGNGIDGTIVNQSATVAASGSATIPCPLTYGRVMLHAGNTGANLLNFNRFMGSEGLVEAFSVASGAGKDEELIFQKRAALFTIVAPGAGSTGNVYIVTQFDKG